MNSFDILESLGVTVKRPETWPHDAKFSTIHWEAQGYYNYCPRDVLLVIGDHIIETPNVIRSRAQETFSYRTLLMDYLKSGAKWYSAPKPMLLDSLFDGRSGQAHAAQRRTGLRCGKRPAVWPGFDLSGQRHRQRAGRALAADDPGRQISGSFSQGCLLRQPHRLDLRGLAPRPDPLQSRLVSTMTLCPQILKQWKVIYSPPMENTDRYDADYLSKCIGSDWIDMNAFSINPNLVVVDRDQTALIKLLEKHGLDVIPLNCGTPRCWAAGPIALPWTSAEQERSSDTSTRCSLRMLDRHSVERPRV